MIKSSKYLFYGLFCAVFVAFLACNNELQLNDVPKDIPIVYGVLNKQDTAHYIRVDKAFIDESKGAIELAKDATNFTYSDINVYLRKDGTTKDFLLKRVDANKEGYQRTEGTFATSPNYVYKIKQSELPLESNAKYRLIIKKQGSDQVLSEATTSIVPDVEAQLSLPPNPIVFRYNSNFSIGWRADVNSAKLFDVRIIVYFDEFPRNSPAQTKAKSIEWVLEKNLSRGSNPTAVTTIRKSGVEFYKFLGDNLTADVNTFRKFKSIDVLVDAGGQEFVDLLTFTNANNGLSGAETINTFSNLSYGKGLFASKNQLKIQNIALETLSRDSLKSGIYTKKLNFQ